MSDDKQRKTFLNTFNWNNSPENNKSGNKTQNDTTREGRKLRR